VLKKVSSTGFSLSSLLVAAEAAGSLDGNADDDATAFPQPANDERRRARQSVPISSFEFFILILPNDIRELLNFTNLLYIKRLTC
jgi:hypothetical protein